MNTPAHASDADIDRLLEARGGPGSPEEIRGMTLEQWTAQNADRIWKLLRTGDCRHMSFNDLARALWNQL
ncbi:MAG: hypothetical protein ABI640_13115 [Gammaproteobacteria bacterium]